MMHKLMAAAIAATLWATITPAQASPGQITSLSATTLERSDYLEIFGSNFGTDGSVLIDGTSAPVADWQSTKIVAYVPEAAQLAAVPVQVVNTLGEASNTLNLTVTARQPDGQVNWRFRQNGPYSKVRPVIGPDGTIYSIDAFSHLYAVTSDGGLKWVVRGAGSKGVAVGADSTVYTASESAVQAFNADGSAKWTYVENPMALFLVAISVGPDGNIYAVATQGVGVFSLTPAGVLRWKQPEPYDAQEPVEYQEILFGPNGSTTQLYFYANSHLKALRLDGGSAFKLAMDFGQPAVGPDGSIHAPYGAYSPSGGLLWVFVSPYPYNISSPPDVGNDGTHYLVQNTIELFALNTDGSQRWHVTMKDTGDRPIVDPQNTQLILGSATTLNKGGYIKSANTQDGHELWRVTLPAEAGFNQAPDTRARFSPAGSTAYIITYTATGDNNTSRSFLYALNTGTSGSSGPTPTSVISRKVQGRAGTFDINLPLTGAAGVECRTGGASGTYQVVYSFLNAVTVGGATVAPGIGGSGSVVGAPIVSADGKTVTVNLTGVTNTQTISINLSGVSDGTNTNDVAISMGILIGDTTGDRVVNGSDVTQTRSFLGQRVTTSNFRCDVTADGTIKNPDLSLIKSNKGTALP